MPYLLTLIIKCVFGFWAMAVAVGKGRSGGWFWLAFFFPVIGVIVAYCLREWPEAYDTRPNYGVTVQCPYYQNGLPTPLAAMQARQAAESLPAPRAAEVSDDGKWVICAGCGERATLYYARIRKLCPHCGTPYALDSSPQEIIEIEETKPEAAQGEAPAQPAPEQPGRVCGSCGQANAPNAAFCMFCGAKIAADWTCLRCAAANPASAKYCMQCGAKKDG